MQLKSQYGRILMPWLEEKYWRIVKHPPPDAKHPPAAPSFRVQNQNQGKVTIRGLWSTATNRRLEFDLNGNFVSVVKHGFS